MKKNKVILDTNFLLVPYKYHIDIFAELNYLVGNVEFVISKGITNELNSLASKKGKAALEARFALKILERNKKSLKIISSVKSVDKWIEEYAKKYNTITCTNDIRLKNILKKNKLRVIVIKSKSKVDFV